VATASLVAVCVVVSSLARSMQTRPRRVVENVVAIGWLCGARLVTVRQPCVLVFVKCVVAMCVVVRSVARSMPTRPRRVVDSVVAIGWLCGARLVTMKQPCFPAFVHSATARGACIVRGCAAAIVVRIGVVRAVRLLIYVRIVVPSWFASTNLCAWSVGSAARVNVSFVLRETLGRIKNSFAAAGSATQRGSARIATEHSFAPTLQCVMPARRFQPCGANLVVLQKRWRRAVAMFVFAKWRMVANTATRLLPRVRCPGAVVRLMDVCGCSSLARIVSRQRRTRVSFACLVGEAFAKSVASLAMPCPRRMS